jgi:hypothetical protein
MRLLLPLVIVGVTAHLSPGEAVYLALHDGRRYGELLAEAHPAIAAFGGMFLLMLFLDYVFEELEFAWLEWLERPLARIGKLDQLSVVVALLLLLITAQVLAVDEKIHVVLVSGVTGLVTYVLVNGLGELFASGGGDASDDEGSGSPVVGLPGRRQGERLRFPLPLPRSTGCVVQLRW